MNSPIIDFYTGNSGDAAGRNIAEVLSKSTVWYEASHDYIQWLFPLRDPSNFNPDAPLLTNEDIVELCVNDQARQNFERAIQVFLNFLGIREVNIGFDFADNFETQKYTWFEFNHNALRITRFLSCLSILGRRRYAEILLGWMLVQLARAGIQKSENNLNYWIKALDCK